MVNLICRILDEKYWLSHYAQPIPKQHTATPNLIAYWPQRETDSSPAVCVIFIMSLNILS